MLKIKVAILFLLLTGCSMSKVGQIDYNPIDEAIFNNDIGGVIKLINSGYDINTFNKLGFLPISTAITNDKFEIVELLLEHGSKIIYTNIETDESCNLLSEFEKKKQYHLIAKFYNQQLKESNGVFKHLRFIPYDYFANIIEKGIDIYKKNYWYDSNGNISSSHTYFDRAIVLNRFDIALLLYKKDQSFADDISFMKICMSPCNDYVFREHLEEFIELLIKDKKIVYGLQNEFGIRDIEFAMSHSNYSILKPVLDDGFDLSKIGLNNSEDILDKIKDYEEILKGSKKRMYFLLLKYL